MTVERSDLVSQDPQSGRAAVAVDVIESRPDGSRRWVGTWYLVRGPVAGCSTRRSSPVNEIYDPLDVGDISLDARAISTRDEAAEEAWLNATYQAPVRAETAFRQSWWSV